MVKPLDVALAVLVAVLWGVAFVFSKLALQTFSAPQLVALRFLVAAPPALLLARPNVPWPTLILVGLTLFAASSCSSSWASPAACRRGSRP